MTFLSISQAINSYDIVQVANSTFIIADSEGIIEAFGQIKEKRPTLTSCLSIAITGKHKEGPFCPWVSSISVALPEASDSTCGYMYLSGSFSFALRESYAIESMARCTNFKQNEDKFY
ncbi:hypothetical protein DINM_002235 [Dirofilaria immitis]|nr:hypothetical protein [Dirofilaria immitis]